MFASSFDGLGLQARRRDRKPATGVSEAMTDRAAALTAPQSRRVGRRSTAGRGSGLPSRIARFLPDRRGAVAVETAVSIVILVIACGGLMAVAHAAYTDDRIARAARAAARTVAFMTEASPTQATLASVACGAIKRELQLADDFDCATKLTMTVATDLVPAGLATGTNPEGESGDMVLVKIGWSSTSSVLGDSSGNAVGVARREPTD